MKEVADILQCSVHKVSYWMGYHNFGRRSISEGVYIKNNPYGDPFMFRPPSTKSEAVLYGVGLGLYWGEGTKANKHSIRLGNTDPKLIKKFVLFLETFFAIRKTEMRFGLQIFSTMSGRVATAFWANELGVSHKQFMKTVITPARNLGTYHKKIKHGVLTVYFHNKKARDILVKEIEKL